MTSDQTAVRPLTDYQDLVEAVRLQKQIWGFDELELLPVRLFVVANKVGGQVFGAFDRQKMIGFLLAIPGIKPGAASYLHSHMMGVLSDYRDRGVGRQLKLHQKEEALSRGISLVEWTFDPLELRNAYFNIERLGVVIRRYVLNQYGTTSSALHGGLPTDRCIAEWHLNLPRHSVPVETTISIPVAISEIRRSNPERARAIQKQASEQFLQCFNEGLTVIGFRRGETAGTYLLGKWHS